MNYDKINKIDIDGSGNITLQDVTGRDITVNYNDTAEFSKLVSLANEKLLSEIQKLIAEQENTNYNFEQILKNHLGLPPEIKKEKQSISKEIMQLQQYCINKTDELNKQNNIQEKELNRNKKRQNQNLIKALKRKSCILFVGPEISVDENDNSIHEKFYQELCDNSEDGELQYDKNTGFFQPNKDPWFDGDIKDFYSGDFKKQNKKGKEIIKKLVSLPFKLIISLAPDNTVKDTFEKYDLQKEFLFYDKTEIPQVKPSEEKPVILNILGSAESATSEWKYIFTYKDFYEYIKNISIPAEIENEIKNAVHFLFIGFDFEKFYNTLLLFILKLNKESDIRKFKQAVEPDKLNPNVNQLLKKEFNISLIEKNYSEFTDLIIRLAKEENLCKNLDRDFIDKQLFSLKELADELTDAKTKSETKEINKKLSEIKTKLQ